MSSNNKLTISDVKKANNKRRQIRLSGFLIVNFEHIPHLFLVFILLI